MGIRKNIVTIADSGDRLETLRALRHKVAETISKSESGRDIAALSRQLREVMAEIEECSNGAPEDVKENLTVLEMVRAKRGQEA